MTQRKIRCRYLNRLHDQCPNEALDAGDELVLCGKHTAAAMRMAARVATTTQRITFPATEPTEI